MPGRGRNHRSNGAMIVTPESFGCVGDGTTDDTANFQAALNSCGPGKTLWCANTYKHTAVLPINRAGTTIAGPGVILATAEGTSAVQVLANNVSIDGVTFRMASTTARGSLLTEHKLMLGAGVSGTILRNLLIDGSRASGIFVYGAKNFVVDNCKVQNTRADGLHMTNGASFGYARNHTSSATGDDGVAVVSYLTDASMCHDILIESPTVTGNTFGRGCSVVGGDSIRWTNVNVTNSFAASLYFAVESSNGGTYSTTNVTVTGGTLTGSNTGAAGTDHGAVLCYIELAGKVVQNITMTNLALVNTNTAASRSVGTLVSAGSMSRVEMDNFAITGTGTPTTNPLADQTAGAGYNSIGWTINGVPRTDHTGF
jgi:hypothetical protein